MIRRLLVPALVLPLAVAGCAKSGEVYPSLAPRVLEKQGFDEPIATPPILVADPALDGQLAELGERLDAVAKGFDTATADATRKGAAARGRAAGSDPWLEAQTALAALDDWRAQASALATDVEQLAVTRAADLKPAYPAADALGDRAAAEAKRQADTIARLQAQLAPA